MPTIIEQNIKSKKQQKGIRTSVSFIRSTFNLAYFQFNYDDAGLLNVGDKVFVLFSVNNYIETEIINITGNDVTIDTMLFVMYPATFTRFVVLPPDVGLNVEMDVSVVAAFNPVVITMVRNDFSFLLTINTDTDKYVFDAGADAAQFVPDTFIQIVYWQEIPNYYPRIKISSVVGTIVYLDLDYIPPLNSTTIVFNLESRLNFYIVLRITENRTNSVFRDLRFTPDKYGNIRAEISGALRSFLNLNYTEPDLETDILTNEENLSIGFYFSILEKWIGSNNSFPSGGAIKTCIAGAFQIGDPNNGYYDKYYGNPEGTLVYPDLMPQWITQFENPVYFYGFPFTLSFLGNETMYDYENYFVRLTFTWYDGSITTHITQPFVTSEFIGLAKLNIALILSDPLILYYVQNSKKIEIRFGRGESGLFLDAFAPITLNVKRSIEQSCNTFYVRWLNTLGGWDYWLFQGKIYEALNVENGNNYINYFDEISTISDFENVTLKNVSPAIQVGSNTLTRNEAEGLKVLPTSPKVYWYNEELSKWIGVIVEPGTFNIRSTKEDYFNVELTFVKPKYFNQFA
jgi:hypothetical protein